MLVMMSSMMMMSATMTMTLMMSMMKMMIGPTSMLTVTLMLTSTSTLTSTTVLQPFNIDAADSNDSLSFTHSRRAHNLGLGLGRWEVQGWKGGR